MFDIHTQAFPAAPVSSVPARVADAELLKRHGLFEPPLVAAAEQLRSQPFRVYFEGAIVLHCSERSVYVWQRLSVRPNVGL